MFKTGKLVGFAVVAVLALSGCASAGAAEPVEKVAAEVSAPVLTAEPVEATPAEDEFLTAAHRIVGLEDVKMDAALAVGEDVCAKLDAGKDPRTLTPVVDGDEATNEEMVIVSVLTLCTDHNEPVQQIFSERRGQAAALAG